MAEKRRDVRCLEHVAHRLRAGTGKVRPRALRDHVVQHLTAELRHRRVALTVHGSAKGIVEEMMATDNPVPRRFEPIEINEVALRRMRPLGSRNAAEHLLARLTVGEETVQIGVAAQDSKITARVVLGAGQPFRLADRPPRPAAPAARPPELRDGKRRGVVEGTAAFLSGFRAAATRSRR